MLINENALLGGNKKMDVLYKSQNEKENGITTIQSIDQENSPLKYTAVKALKLDEGATYTEVVDGWEACVVAQVGKVTVKASDEVFENIGQRTALFEKIPTDSVYVNRNQEITIEAITEAQVVIAYAPSDKDLPTKLIAADDIRPEHRGKYSNQRLALTILGDDDDFADSLLVVEVFTDSGNWSSYPPHKHDQNNLPEESFLEEIYYHEVNPPQGFVFQRIYTEDGSIDETNAVENKDSVIVPAGYHPVAVPDGYDSYYLNVMAGPVRTWNFHNEKDHEWILDRD